MRPAALKNDFAKIRLTIIFIELTVIILSSAAAFRN